MSYVSSLKSLVAGAKLRIEEITVQEAAERLAAGAARVLDVREPAEYTQGTVADALHVPRGMLEAKADLEYEGREPELQDREQAFLIMCKSGARSALAADTLRQMGFSHVTSVAGGFEEWVKQGLPLDVPDRCCY